MEAQLRSYLYANLGRQVAFNPLEPEPFDIVDLTKDVTNATRIYHLRTECLREALAGACLIVADSPLLASAVRSVLPKTAVAILPFGVAPLHPKLLLHASRELDEGHNGRPTVGLLNHSGDVEMNNRYALDMLRNLDRELLIYGHALPGVEGEVTENFGDFCHRCDVLLLPSLPGVINSITLPLALMAAGTAVLAHNAPGYYDLDAATGAQLLPCHSQEWHAHLVRLEVRPALLKAMQERNSIYAQKINRSSLASLKPILEQADLRPREAPAASSGCGCHGSTRSAPTAAASDDESVKNAPTEPTQEFESIIEKEQ